MRLLRWRLIEVRIFPCVFVCVVFQRITQLESKMTDAATYFKRHPEASKKLARKLVDHLLTVKVLADHRTPFAKLVGFESNRKGLFALRSLYEVRREWLCF